jgi:hypothetical protein
MILVIFQFTNPLRVQSLKIVTDVFNFSVLIDPRDGYWTKKNNNNCFWSGENKEDLNSNLFKYDLEFV